MRQNDNLKGLMASMWSTSDCGRAAGGPVRLIRESLARLGWSWPAPFHVSIGDGEIINICTVDWDHWAHLVRDGLRQLMWKTAAQRRPDMRGIEAG
eukprot:12006204-Karenia_brevis.AAC.1